MTLESISYIGQTIAAIAVVVSLLYLAVQVRHAERNQRAMMQQVRTGRGILLSMCFTEPSMANVMTKAMMGDAEFNPEEQTQLMAYTRSLALNLLDAHAFHEMSLLSDAAFERASAGSRWFFGMAPVRATWTSVNRAQFATQDAAIIEKMAIDGVPVSAPMNMIDAVKKARALTVAS